MLWTVVLFQVYLLHKVQTAPLQLLQVRLILLQLQQPLQPKKPACRSARARRNAEEFLYFDIRGYSNFLPPKKY